jgi:alkylation response protein AidB-like acyl-CoA dehydrogenase
MTPDGPDLGHFRTDVRAWVAKTFPPPLKGKNPLAQEERTKLSPEQDAWREAVGERGFGTPTWPQAYGGGGLSTAEARVVQDEFARAGAYNPIGGMGVMMLGPTLLEFGSEAQKLEHLPLVCRGEIQWCQGFSEPGAGSDLASLQTRAVDKGDHFVITGQKLWTSGAQTADWCFCLVRSDTSKKHEGISFVLLSMAQAGVEVRPIPLIAGNSPFCETFFTDAIAHKKDLVGPLNGGWTIAKRLLQHERSGISTIGGRMYGQRTSLDQLAKQYVGVDAQGRIADRDLRLRIVRNQMDGRALQLTTHRAAAEARTSSAALATSSILKNAGTWMIQERAELTIEILGMQALGWEGDGFSAEELAAVRNWLSGKASTIYGGSQEIQNNVVAKRTLGLPDATS